MAEEIDVPVLIVGGGPIGLTLSCILGQNNIEHVLLEKNESTTKWPKAMLTNTRSMELYHRLGLDSILRKKAFSEDGTIIVGKSLLEKPFLQISPSQMTGMNPHQNTNGAMIFDERWTKESICRLSQIYMEPTLKAEANKNSSSDIKYGWQVLSVSQTEEYVVIEAMNVKSGERKVYRARYAVGCDGGKSFVRKSLGVRFKGKFDLGRFQTISFESKELKNRLVVEDILGAVTLKSSLINLFLPLDKEGNFVCHCIPTDEQAKPDELLRSLLDNEDISYTIKFTNEWQGHFAHAETLQEGDSCHVMIPVGGFGMNTGVLDAYDLGWKLVATIQGWGGQKLLASYTAERLPSIRKLLRRITQMYTTLRRYAGIFGFAMSTPVVNFILRRVVDTSNLNPGVSGILFGIRLESSPICIPSDATLPPQNPLYYTPIAYPGCRAPYFEFGDESSLYDKLGPAFTLLYLKSSSQKYEPIVAAAEHYGIPLKVLVFDDQKLKKLYRGMDLVLIRPDLYIAWCGNEIPTLKDSNDVNKGAAMLMKIITGAENIPAEWQSKPKNKHTMSAVWLVPLTITFILGLSAASIALLRHYFLT